MPLRAGFIGAGPRARIAHLPSVARLQETGEVTLAAICDLDEHGRVWFDIARVQGPMDCIRSLRDTVGTRRLLFGSNLPFIVPESPIMELGDARLSDDEDAAVRYRNAVDALGIS